MTLSAIRPVYTTRSPASEQPEEHPLTPRTLERFESLFEPRPAPRGDAGHLLPGSKGLTKPSKPAKARQAFSVIAPPPAAIPAGK